MSISKTDFEKLVDDGIAMIPSELRALIDNVEITIEDAPSDRLLAELGLTRDDALYGLYQGTPLTERMTDYSAMPDKIAIYHRPLTEDFTDPDELRYEVARTVIHEIAHHFGIDEDRLVELGWD
jgi:predicted Zn-dependent protease with MMP-like domain